MNLEMDHVAVPSRNIGVSVAWYVEKYGAEVLYQDATWAMLRLGQGKLALVTPNQHLPHVALRIKRELLDEAANAAGQAVEKHRDGTCGIFVGDPDGNQVELICYPGGETIDKD